jgi:hypothetical protein
MTLRAKKLIALAIVLTMAIGLAVPAFADNDDTLATPVLIPGGETAMHPPSPHSQCRVLLFDAVDGATGYNVYAFASFADAVAGENAVAVSRNAQATAESQSVGGTTAAATVSPDEGQVLIDVRLIEFDYLVEGATRTLPEGYTPAGIGCTWHPGEHGVGDTTNLRPGQYWFTVRAVDVDNPARNSEMSAPYEDGDAFSISMGPDEARALIEELLLTKELGDTLHIVDLRGPFEFSDEGVLRFTTLRHVVNDFYYLEDAEEIFGHVNDKSAVTIFVY